MHHAPTQRSSGFPIAPTTRLGRWAVGLVAAAAVLVAAVVMVVPADSLAASLVASSGGALVLAGGGSALAAIFRHGERALSVYAAAFVLVGGILFLLLHSLFISD